MPSVPGAGYIPFILIAREHELLLRAALLSGEAAVGSWREWVSLVDINRLDPPSRRLLPLLYFNLNSLGISDPRLKKFKGVMRLFWAKNQILFVKIKNLLQAFQQAGISVMLLKGMAFAHSHYQNWGLRPMGDADILVRPEQVSAAIALLVRAGWKTANFPLKGVTRDYLASFHAIVFENETGEAVDLHWHALSECGAAGDDDDFWKDAVTGSLDGVPIFLMNPGDQLFHACVHGYKQLQFHEMPSSLCWAADAMIMLNSRIGPMDFQRILDQAGKRHLVLALRQSMEFLQERLAALLPQAFLQSLRNLPFSKLETRESLLKFPSERLSAIFSARWLQYLRQAGRFSGGFRIGDIGGFAAFLKGFYALAHFWELPFCFFSKLYKRIRRSRVRHAHSSRFKALSG